MAQFNITSQGSAAGSVQSMMSKFGSAAAGQSAASFSAANVAGGVGVAIAGLAALGMAAKNLADSFAARGKELSGLSPQLAGASAVADVRSLVSDFREAMTLGSDMAQLIDSQSRIESDVREMLLPIKQALLDVLVPLFEEIADVTKDLRGLGGGIVEAVKVLGEVIVEAISLKFEAASKTLETLGDRFEQGVESALTGRTEVNLDPIATLQRILGPAGPAVQPKDPQKIMLEQRLNQPALREFRGVAPLNPFGV